MPTPSRPAPSPRLDSLLTQPLGALLAEASLRPAPRSQDRALWILVLSGAIPAVLAFVLWRSAGTEQALFAAVPAALLLASAGVRAVLHKPVRGRLSVFEQGLAFLRDGRTTSATWAQLERISLREAEAQNNGKPIGVVRRLTLGMRGQTLVLSDFASANLPRDPFGEAVSHLLTQRAREAQRAVEVGGVLSGEGWALTRDGLRGRKGAPTPLSRLASVGLWEGNVRVWVEGDDAPVVDVPAASPNARVLLSLGEALTRDKPATTTQSGIGRRLFTKRVGLWAAVFAGLLALGGIAGAVGVFGQPEMEVWVGLFGAGAVAFGVGAAWAARARTDVHERGVRQQGLLGARELAFTDVAGFTYGATRQYVNGAYTGTAYVLRFRPAPGSGRPIRLSFTSRNTDEDTAALRDGVSRIVVSRLLEAVKRQGRVAWCNVALSPEGVHYRTGLFNKGPEAVLPLQQARHRIHEGKLELCGPSSNKPLVSVPCAGENFFPGLLLFELLASRG